MGAFPGRKGAEAWGGGKEMETGSPRDGVGIQGAEQSAVASCAPNAPLYHSSTPPPTWPREGRHGQSGGGEEPIAESRLEFFLSKQCIFVFQGLE